jgi:hypothetical protein
MDEFRQQKKEYDQRTANVEKMKARVERAERLLKDHDELRPDMEEARKAFDEQRRQIIHEAIGGIEKLAGRFRIMREQILEGMLGQAESTRLGHRISMMRREREDRKGELGNLEVGFRERVGGSGCDWMGFSSESRSCGRRWMTSGARRSTRRAS